MSVEYIFSIAGVFTVAHIYTIIYYNTQKKKVGFPPNGSTLFPSCRGSSNKHRHSLADVPPLNPPTDCPSWCVSRRGRPRALRRGWRCLGAVDPTVTVGKSSPYHPRKQDAAHHPRKQDVALWKRENGWPHIRNSPWIRWSQVDNIANTSLLGRHLYFWPGFWDRSLHFSGLHSSIDHWLLTVIVPSMASKSGMSGMSFFWWLPLYPDKHRENLKYVAGTIIIDVLWFYGCSMDVLWLFMPRSQWPWLILTHPQVPRSPGHITPCLRGSAVQPAPLRRRQGPPMATAWDVSAATCKPGRLGRRF